MIFDLNNDGFLGRPLTLAKIVAAAKLLDAPPPKKPEAGAASPDEGAKIHLGEVLIVELPDWLAQMVTPAQLKLLVDAAHEKGAPLTETEGLNILGLG